MSIVRPPDDRGRGPVAEQVRQGGKRGNWWKEEGKQGKGRALIILGLIVIFFSILWLEVSEEWSNLARTKRPCLPARNKQRYIVVLYCCCVVIVRFAAQFRGGTLGSRMEKMSSSSSPLQINKPAVIWRGGFKMPPRKVPPNPNDRQQQQQLHQQQHRRVDPMGTAGGGSRRGAPLAAGGGGGGGRNIGTSRSQLLPASDSVLGGAGADPRLPGIPNMLESAGGDEHGISSAGVLGRGARVSVGSLALSADAPHRGRFVRQR